ncbi:MAE_28990/MAE_18760 family HEPN-like nuclease [Nitrosovibrio tenuis]|uniref:MAE-28990/MAE-18760-like HEPN domain-containing protein n=1 Tax=Nitrosovibrio tenuis TaxID=1233 RepID=A0A1H7LM00_9PROT|nr:MAE_28990/MAE_18760 family HEPN-like nuclease [Nitrosovibrio tenuis]SEK99961.1 hypothetical protein SAMN05216387_104104 [Nitrosovibrio tenuis]
MLNAQAEFEKRESEIKEYLLHLETLELETGFPIGIMNTMKSSALLMIYNCIESTMTNLLQDVFDHLHSNNVEFDSLNATMKTLVLGYSKKRKPSSLVEKMQTSAMGLAVACFDRSDVFSGNLDCKTIKETLKHLGVRSTHKYQETVLQTVKHERNELAHGIKSFSDCGKHYSAKQLRSFHDKTSAVLKRVIYDFEGFLNLKAYK